MNYEVCSIETNICEEVLLLYKSMVCKRWSIVCPVQRILIVSLFCQVTFDYHLTSFRKSICHVSDISPGGEAFSTVFLDFQYELKHCTLKALYVSHNSDNKKCKSNNYTLVKLQAFLQC